jgi:hypothetical protein
VLVTAFLTYHQVVNFVKLYSVLQGSHKATPKSPPPYNQAAGSVFWQHFPPGTSAAARLGVQQPHEQQQQQQHYWASTPSSATPMATAACCSLCKKKVVMPPKLYCPDCDFYLAKLKAART